MELHSSDEVISTKVCHKLTYKLWVMYTSLSIHPYFRIPSFIFIGQIAQWLMLLTVNQKGLGSNPSLSAIRSCSSIG